MGMATAARDLHRADLRIHRSFEQQLALDERRAVRSRTGSRENARAGIGRLTYAGDWRQHVRSLAEGASTLARGVHGSAVPRLQLRHGRLQPPSIPASTHRSRTDRQTGLRGRWSQPRDRPVRLASARSRRVGILRHARTRLLRLRRVWRADVQTLESAARRGSSVSFSTECVV